jgi:hypothetical protein
VTTSAARIARAAGPTERLRSIVELGHEPPIEIGEPRIDGRERRRISLRWFAGVALSGLSGLALIGAALYLDLDRQSNFAEAPELANLARHDEAEGVNPSKGDRLVRPIDVVAAKQTYKAPTTIKIGDKEVVRMRPFTILSTALTLTPNAYADAVPQFDPLMVTSGAAEKADAPPDPGPAQDDAEVAFSQRDLAADEAVAATGELTLAEAQAQVSELLKAAASGRRRARPALAAPAQAHQPGRHRPARRPLLRRRRLGQRQRALRLDRSQDGARERHRRGDDASAGRKPRATGAIASRRSVRGPVARQRREQGRRRRDPRRLRRQARRIAGRRGTEGHPAIRRCGARQAGDDRARLGLRRRATQIDDRDQRRGRLCAGDAAARRRPAQ